MFSVKIIDESGNINIQAINLENQYFQFNKESIIEIKNPIISKASSTDKSICPTTDYRIDLKSLTNVLFYENYHLDLPKTQLQLNPKKIKILKSYDLKTNFDLLIVVTKRDLKLQIIEKERITLIKFEIEVVDESKVTSKCVFWNKHVNLIFIFIFQFYFNFTSRLSF